MELNVQFPKFRNCVGIMWFNLDENIDSEQVLKAFKRKIVNEAFDKKAARYRLHKTYNASCLLDNLVLERSWP